MTYEDDSVGCKMEFSTTHLDKNNSQLKLTLCFSISLAFSQNSFVNLSIEGMHCAGGCAKMIENSLNSNKGITAAVDFNNASASII